MARIKALAGAALLGIFQGDYAHAETVLAEGLALALEIEDPTLVSEAISNAAFLSYRRGEYARAEALALAALPYLREQSETWSAPLLILGDTAMAQERFDRASIYYREAIDRFQEAPRYVAVGKRGDLSDALAGLAGANYCSENLVLAAAQYRESLAGAQELGFPIHVASALLGLAAVAASSGQAEAGSHLLGAAEGTLESLGTPIFPRDRPIRERGLSALRLALGEKLLAANREVGRSMEIEQVLAEARSVAAAIAASTPAERV